MQQPQTSVELLQALVQIPSVNPAGTPGTDGIGEQRCAEYVGRFLAGIGAQVEIREVLPGRPNVIGRFPSDREGKPRLLLAPHTDTVSVAGMIIDPFAAEIRDGRLWGRGASDTKGSMAAMLWALRLLGDRVAHLSHEIWFAGLAGEEAGQHGAKALAAEERFDFVIAGEPTMLDVVNTHKGCTNLHLKAFGKSAHASQPHLGKNAIYQIADVTRFIREELAPEFEQATDPTLGHSTINVGTISGGSKTNIVPDFCEATVDIRTVPSQNTPDFLERLTARLQEIAPGLEISAGHSVPLQTDPHHPVIAKLERLGAKCVGAPWFCDAAVFAGQGVPAIAMGPGSIAQAHTDDEWIEIAEFERGVEFFRAFLSSL